MLTLAAKIRTELGKKNKKVRKEALLPCVFYGRKVKSIPLSVSYRDFERVYKEAGENMLISITIENGEKGIPKENTVLIRHAFKHPLSGLFTHTDFYRVPMDEKIRVSVPIRFVNEAPALRNEGAVLVRNVFGFEISALPKDLPREIMVDLSSLKRTGDSITLKNVVFPQGVEVDLEDDFVVAAAAAPVQEEAAEEAAAAGAVPAASDIKTEGEVKRAEKEAKKMEEEATA